MKNTSKLFLSLTITLVAINISFNCFSQKAMTFFPADDIWKGSVKHIIRFQYNASFSLIIPKFKAIYQFDKNSKLIEESFFDEEKLQERHTLIYDNKGRLEELKVYPKTEYSTKYVYKYDNKGRVIEEKQTQSWDITRFIKYTFDYDYSDNLIKLCKFDLNNIFMNQQKCKYLNDGKREELSFLSLDDPDQSFIIRYQYDVIKKEVHKIRRELSNRSDSEEISDWRGNVISLRKSYEKIASWKWNNVYDKQGNMVKRSTYVDGKLFMVIEWQISYW